MFVKTIKSKAGQDGFALTSPLPRTLSRFEMTEYIPAECLISRASALQKAKAKMKNILLADRYEGKLLLGTLLSRWIFEMLQSTTECLNN